MKSFVTEGTGSQQTLRNSQDNKIPVYPTEADLDTDLANLADGELALYPSEGASLSVPVDEVKSGDMHAVTSNAVANAIGNYYPSGSYSFTDDGIKMLLPAYVSSSSTSLVFMLPIIHDSDKTVNFTNIGLACRTGLGGYVEGSGARKINMTDYNFSFIDRGRFGITVTVTKKDGTAWQNATTSATVTNNTGCIASIAEIEFTVS